MMEEKEEVVAIEDNSSTKKGKIILDFLITTLNGMAYGLFATLIIGTIISTIGSFFPNGEGANDFCKFMNSTIKDGATCLQLLTGAGIGVGIALGLKLDSLKTIVLAMVGEIAAFFSLSTKFVTAGAYSNGMKIGDPLTIYIVCIMVALAIKFVLKKKTPVDVILIPLFGAVSGIIASMLVRYPTIYVTYGIQWIVDKSTLAQPFIMGIIISVVMGMALTAPISSAAIAAMIFTVGANETLPEGLAIASGAAIIGCCTQMVGFAIQSRKDNSIGMVISILIGTSMLQFKNILKKPIVWLPTIIASAILGPFATMLFKVRCAGSSAGMGTAGLVGQIGTLNSMGYTWQAWLIVIFFEVLTPLVLVFFIDLLFRKFKLIEEGDLRV